MRRSTGNIEIKSLAPGEEGVLENVAPDVFDDEVHAERTREFLSDERHHLVVAVDGGTVVGFVSAVHYLHPDKPEPEMWINEVGVAPSHQKRGIGKAMMRKILHLGHELGCSEAWVLTERDNTSATGLYRSSGGTEEYPAAVMFIFHLNEAHGTGRSIH